MKKIFAQILFLILIVTNEVQVKASVQKKDLGISINADEMYHRQDNKEIKLKGHVKLKFKIYELSADKATVNLKTNQITATGNIILKSKKVTLTAEKIKINYKSSLGELTNASIKSGNVSLKGKIIQKLDETNYVLEEASLTTCNNCPASWSFSGSRIDAQIGERAVIKYPILKILDIPLIPLFHLSLPLNSNRQSGLLIPSFEGDTKSGLSYTQSYFLALGQSQDMTFTIKYHEQNGIKGLMEYRRKLDKQSHIQLNTGTIKDKTFKKPETQKKTEAQRTFFKYIHKLNLSRDYVQRVDLLYLSDLNYIRDFPEDISQKRTVNIKSGESTIENKVSLSKSNERSFSSIEAVININLLKTDPSSDNQDAIHRLPEIRYSLLEQELYKTGLNFSLDTQYTHFYRRKSKYDDICLPGETCNGELVPDGEKRVNETPDGIFNPDRDLLRTGQRLKWKSTLSKPLIVGEIFDILPSVTYSHSHYLFNYLSSVDDPNYNNQAYLQNIEAQLSVRTQLSHIYGLKNIVGSTLYKHIIEPEIRFVSNPWHKQSRHNFFKDINQESQRFDKITNNDFFNSRSSLQFDYDDRRSYEKTLNYSITNRIIRKDQKKKNSRYKNLLFFNINQSYNLRKNTKKTSRAWSKLDAQVQMNFDSFELFNVSAYHPYFDIIDHYTRLRFKNTAGNFIQFAYTEDRILTKGEGDQAPVDTPIKSQQAEIDLNYSGKIFGFGAGLSYSLTDKDIRHWRTVISYKPPGECWEIITKIQQYASRDEIDYKWLFKFDFDKESLRSKN